MVEVDIGGFSDHVGVIHVSNYQPFLGIHLGDILALSLIGIFSFILYRKFKTNKKGYYADDLEVLKNG